MLQIAVVGKSRFRVEVKTDLDVLVFELQGLGEAGVVGQAMSSKLPSSAIIQTQVPRGTDVTSP